MFEQPFADFHAVFNLERKRTFGETRRHRRAEKIRAFERAIALRKIVQMRFGDPLEMHERFLERVRGQSTAAGGVPLAEERLEERVQQLTPLLRRKARLLLPLLVETENMRREVLEGTFDVPLDAAHGIGI